MVGSYVESNQQSQDDGKFPAMVSILAQALRNALGSFGFGCKKHRQVEGGWDGISTAVSSAGRTAGPAWFYG